MKIIYPDNVSAATADSEDANYPASNLTDRHPKKLWKAASGIYTSIVTVTVSGASSGVAIYNTNADSVAIAVSSEHLYEWELGWDWESGWAWETYSTADIELYDTNPAGVGAFWGEYTDIASTHDIDITFTAASGTTVEAGVVKAGPVYSFRDPIYGITEGLKDYSVVNELNNGEIYIEKRDVVRVFNIQAYVQRTTEFYNCLLTIMQQAGPDPLAFRLYSAEQEWEWVIYGRFIPNSISGIHSNKTLTLLSFGVIEVV